MGIGTVVKIDRAEGMKNNTGEQETLQTSECGNLMAAEFGVGYL